MRHEERRVIRPAAISARGSGRVSAAGRVLLLASVCLALLPTLAEAKTSTSHAVVETSLVGTDSRGLSVVNLVEVNVKLTTSDSGKVKWKLYATGARKLRFSQVDVGLGGTPQSLNLFEGKMHRPGAGGTERVNVKKDKANENFIRRLVRHPEQFFGNVIGSGVIVKNGKPKRQFLGASTAQFEKGQGPKLKPDPPPAKYVDKRAKADARFKGLRAKVNAKGNQVFTDALVSLTDREIETVEGLDLVCWLGGDRAGGLFVAGGSGLQAKAQAGIQSGIDQYLAGFGRQGLSDCELLVIGAVAYLTEQKKKARTHGPALRKKPNCKAGPIGLEIDDGGVTVQQQASAVALDVSCSYNSTGKRITVDAETVTPGASLADALDAIEVGIASIKSPSKKPKAKISLKQKGSVG